MSKGWTIFEISIKRLGTAWCLTQWTHKTRMCLDFLAVQVRQVTTCLWHEGMCWSVTGHGTCYAVHTRACVYRVWLLRCRRTGPKLRQRMGNVYRVSLALARTLNYGNIWRQNMGVLWPPFNRRVLLPLAGSTAKSGAKKLPSLTGNLRLKSRNKIPDLIIILDI